MSDVQQIGKSLNFIGMVILVVGVAVLVWGKIPFLGKLPGDFSIEKSNFKLYFPLGSGIVLSVVLSLILWLIFYFTKK